MSAHHSQRGALLPSVLAVMVIIALAATAALHMSRQERGASVSSRLQTSAFASVDAALAIGLEQARVLASALRPGASILRHVPVNDPGVDATLRLTRLGETLFALAADANAGTAGGATARRRAALLLRLEPVAISFPAAASLTGSAPVDPGVADGVDRAPTGRPCADSLRDGPAMLHPSPPPDSVALRDLRVRASIRLPAGSSVYVPGPVTRGSECDTSRPDNWGDASGAGACGNWLPIIHAPGDLRVDGGAGQGMLIVDGDLSVSGGFEFTGAVLVGGSMDVGPGGMLVTGGAFATGITGAWVGGARGPVVVRSTCALDAALLAAGSISPVVDRPWVAVR